VIKKLSAALCCAAIATLALAGCGNDAQAKTDAYAKKVCDEVKPQQQNIQAATASIASVSGADTPKQVQQTDSAAFGKIAAAYQALGSAVQKAGASPVANGSALQKNAVRQLDNIAASYANLKQTVDGLDTSDQGKFAQGLKAVSDQLGTLTKSSGDALNQLQAGDVGKAMAKQPGCQKAGAPTGSASANPA
jgi:hypothetical protein